MKDTGLLQKKTHIFSWEGIDLQTNTLEISKMSSFSMTRLSLRNKCFVTKTHSVPLALLSESVKNVTIDINWMIKKNVSVMLSSIVILAQIMIRSVRNALLGKCLILERSHIHVFQNVLQELICHQSMYVNQVLMLLLSNQKQNISINKMLISLIISTNSCLTSLPFL